MSALIWLEDRHGPLYLAPRVGSGGRTFQMIKLRSMVVRADRSGVDSTAKSDRRITRVGAWIRRFKLDELSQLWNVLRGDMSLVGPRPQVHRDVALYTAAERGYVDDVIEPEETRPRLIAALEMLLTKRETLPPRKHGNIPL